MVVELKDVGYSTASIALKLIAAGGEWRRGRDIRFTKEELINLARVACSECGIEFSPAQNMKRDDEPTVRSIDS